jgi:hypothetical protein
MFNYYPIVDYQVGPFDTLSVVDITVRTKINDYIRRVAGVGIRQYQVVNGDRPDVVSNKVYGKPQYSYIILLVNEIHNIYDEWPRDSVSLKNYIVEKYGSLSYALGTTAYYYDGAGNVVSQEFWSALNDTAKYTENYYEYESRLNDEKSRINIMDPSLILKVETSIQEILNSVSIV